MINRRKDGTTYFEDQTITPVMDGAGEIINFIAIKQDVTERKRADESLRESEIQYRALFDGMMDGIYRSTHDGRFLDVNDAMVKMFGYSSKEEMLKIDIANDLY